MFWQAPGCVLTDCSLLSQVPKGQHRHRSCPHLSNSCGSEFLALPTVLQSHYDPTSCGNQREPHFRHLAGIPAPRSSYLSARGGRPPAKTQSHLIEAVCIDSPANNATHKFFMMHTPHTGRSGVRGEEILTQELFAALVAAGDFPFPPSTIEGRSS